MIADEKAAFVDIFLLLCVIFFLGRTDEYSDIFFCVCIIKEVNGEKKSINRRLMFAIENNDLYIPIKTRSITLYTIKNSLKLENRYTTALYSP